MFQAILLAERSFAADVQHLLNYSDFLHSAGVARVLLWICTDRCPTKESSLSGTLRQSRYVDGPSNECPSSSDEHHLDHDHRFSGFRSLLASESNLVPVLDYPAQRLEQ